MAIGYTAHTNRDRARTEWDANKTNERTKADSSAQQQQHEKMQWNVSKEKDEIMHAEKNLNKKIEIPIKIV